MARRKKRQKEEQWSTEQYTFLKTKDRETRTPLKIGGELMAPEG